MFLHGTMMSGCFLHRLNALALELGRSRQTIRRALADPRPWEYPRQRRRPCPVLDPVARVSERWLEQLAPGKQRHTYHRSTSDWCDSLVLGRST